MGIAFKGIIDAKEIQFDELKDKIIVVDSFNLLYQFLTTIRGRDGTALMDSKGRITSHLVGLFSRITKLMSYGIKLAFVFDGKPPELKKKESERRRELKNEAQLKYDKAVEEEDIDSMKKYGGRTVRLTAELISEAKELLGYLGLPIIQAPSEGEAQAAYIVKKGDAYAAVSQDYDSLLHGATHLVRNLSIAGKKKKGLGYETYKPEMVVLSDTLNSLGIDQNQLIVLAMLIGTDYNIGGVKGIGPQNALKLVRQYGADFDTLFSQVKWEFDVPWTEVYYLIKKMPVTDEYRLEWKEINIEKLKEFLISRDFSEERIESSLKQLGKSSSERKQKSLFEFS
ncbi:MAG: flap endonuclease-1 [Nanoarchaeota archaeon]|nr:flap endonuclease-1 [Nanoarchaeota archaeon]MBU1704817.1 flap endonuclease-1 [Nanoarchaeota archaeon]